MPGNAVSKERIIMSPLSASLVPYGSIVDHVKWVLGYVIQVFHGKTRARQRLVRSICTSLETVLKLFPVQMYLAARRTKTVFLVFAISYCPWRLLAAIRNNPFCCVIPYCKLPIIIRNIVLEIKKFRDYLFTPLNPNFVGVATF